MASLVKRGSMYHGVFETLDVTTGGRKQIWKSLSKNKAEATRMMHATQSQIDQGTFVQEAGVTVAEFLTDWLETAVKTHRAHNTYVGYEINVRRHINPVLGNVKLKDLKPRAIEGMLAGMLSRGLLAKTALYVFQTLRAALNQAVRWQMLARSPAEGVTAPRPERASIRVLDEDQTFLVLNHLRGHRLFIPTMLAVVTGMRRGEILGLTWDQVDLDSGIIRVTKSLERVVSGQPVFKGPKTPGSRRAVDVSPAVVDALRRHQSEQTEHRSILGSEYRDHKLVISLEDGRPWDGSNFTAAFRGKMDLLGLVDLRFHDLRHSNATKLLEDGVPVKVVSARLGHSQTRTTLDTYSHVTAHMQERAAQAFEDVLRRVIPRTGPDAAPPQDGEPVSDLDRQRARRTRKYQLRRASRH